MKLTGNDKADNLLSKNSFALLIGMVLDQQVAMEVAFSGPLKILQRLGSINSEVIARCDAAKLEEIFRQSPAVHRFPKSMASRVKTVAEVVLQNWGGEAHNIWKRDNPDGYKVLSRLQELPGFGKQKAKIFLAFLGKQCNLIAANWQDASGEFGEKGVYRSVADVTDHESLCMVREFKRSEKVKAKHKL